MNFILAENLDEVFAVALDKSAKGKNKKTDVRKKKKRTRHHRQLLSF